VDIFGHPKETPEYAPLRQIGRGNQGVYMHLHAMNRISMFSTRTTRKSGQCGNCRLAYILQIMLKDFSAVNSEQVLLVLKAVRKRDILAGSQPIYRTAKQGFLAIII